MSVEMDAVLQAVDLAKRSGADDADAWLSTGRRFNVTVLNKEIEQLEEADSRVLGLRVFVGQRSALVYSSDLASDALSELAGQAIELAKLSGEDRWTSLPEEPFADGADAADLGLYDPEVFAQDPQTLIDLALRAEAAARGHDPKITNSEGANVSRQEGTIALANSHGFAGSYRSSSCSLSASAVVDDADYKKRVGRWETSDRFFGQLEDAELVGRTAARRALGQLGTRKVTTQEAPVVWSPEMARQFLDLLAYAASGELRYQGDSFLIDREGDRLGSPLLTIVDDALLPGRLGSRPFDDEGLSSQRTTLFEAGVFNSFLFDTYSARRAGRESTSNAGRSVAFQRGMTLGVSPSNLTMVAGESSPEEIIAGVRQGLYLTEMLGFGENLATGDFSRGASGFWIEDGALAYPVAEINIAGRIQDMLAGIDAVGNDLSVLDTLAAPTFRIGEMMVSGS